MRDQRPSSRRRALAATVFLTTALAVPATATATPTQLRVPADQVETIAADKGTATYIVWTADDPLVTYDGDIPGLAATAPAEGATFDADRQEVAAYRAYLADRSEAILGRAGAGGVDKIYDYASVFPGFAAELTAAQVAALEADAQVVGVFKNEINQPTTNSTPDFLGLTDPSDGLWEADGLFGEDVVIGVIDSGIWPENPAFADGPGNSYDPLAGWSAACEAGEAFASTDCNDKLIGAQYFVDGIGGADLIKSAFPDEFISPRDADGHGTHTASTSGGNGDVTAVVNGEDFATISGIAPRARLSVYKVCWGYSGGGGCSSVDSVAAIDQAVLDGVDVINYSISGTGTEFLDPVEVAFLFAADSGIVVNASAGNDGPGAGTVNHPSPWLTTVAASTEIESFVGTVTLGDGQIFDGAPSISNPGTSSLPLVWARDAGLSGVDPDDAALCFPDTLDPAAVTDTMVLCERGAIARVAKSDEVAAAGGAAMILGNVSANSLNSDAHVIPTIHVAEDATAAIIDYIEATASPTATQSPAGVEEAVAPNMAAFSSRGPLATSDLLKPDITAPGVDVLAAYSPNIGGRDFDFLSGTSMSSPHMAGMSALIREAHPGWSPAAVKSSLMTTAYQTRTDASPIAGGPFAYGSGHAAPNDAVDPGLVYDAGFLDYLGFICGTGQLGAEVCTDVFGTPVLDPSDLNQPNIAIGALAGSQTVPRTVTNVGPAGTYVVDVDAPAGVDVTVAPSSLTLAPGESATFDVTFTVTTAALGMTVFGELHWSDGTRDVTSQLVVTPVELAAPDEIFDTGTSGSQTYELGFGYSGPFTAAAHELVPSNKTGGVVEDDPANDINTALGTGVGVTFIGVPVPDGQALARFSLFDDFTDGDDDLDLYIFDGDGFFVGGSGSGTSAEQVDVWFPTPGVYTAVVHGWQTDGPDARFTLFDVSFSATPGGTNLTVDAPDAAVLGTIGDATAMWSGLDAGEKYLGGVSYTNGGLIGLTVVNIETAAPPVGDVYCDGVLATIVGTDGPEELIGGPGRDVIAGLGGDDKLVGLGGNDIICGGDGDDEIIGNYGNDRLFGEGDNDRIIGGPGNDRLEGNAGEDTLLGLDGKDELFGGSEDDKVFGGNQDDLLLGGSGDDEVSGGNGNDKAIGGQGEDEIAGGNGNDELFGSPGDDIIRGDAGNDYLYGAAGDDTLDGGANFDKVNGGPDTDTCTGEQLLACELP